MEWYEVITWVIGGLGILSVVAFTAKYKQALNLITEMADALRQSADLFDRVAEALKDRKVTKTEAVLLLKEWQEACIEYYEVYQAIQALLPKNVIKFLTRRG